MRQILSQKCAKFDSMAQTKKPVVASLFAGAGGLDLGFHQAGFEIPWANEYDKNIWATYERNAPRTFLDKRSITHVQPEDLPDIDGLIGGPPCQSWSEAGMSRGIEDHRGQLFFEYLRLLEAKRPRFFLAENVAGLLFSRHDEAFSTILRQFCDLGYNVSYGLLNTNGFGVPQSRERVIIVGYQTSVGKFFVPPQPMPQQERPVLRSAIWDLRDTAMPALDGTYGNIDLETPNHEYLVGTYSTIFMSRNRVRTWDEPSYTIQAGGRHAPLHPQAPRMVKLEKDRREFVKGKEDLYRRLSVREAARVQTFPDEFIFEYESVLNGYKMIGNAVPVEFARRLALQIKTDLRKCAGSPTSSGAGIATFSELISNATQG